MNYEIYVIYVSNKVLALFQMLETQWCLTIMAKMITIIIINLKELEVYGVK